MCTRVRNFTLNSFALLALPSTILILFLISIICETYMRVEQHTIFFNYKIELKIGFDKSLTNSILIDTRFINIFPKRIEACESESRRIFLRIFSLYQRDIRSIISHRYFSSDVQLIKRIVEGRTVKDRWKKGIYSIGGCTRVINAYSTPVGLHCGFRSVLSLSGGQRTKSRGLGQLQVAINSH